MAEPPKRNDPAEWTLVAAAYEEVADPFMGLWAEEALRVANVLPEERILDVATGPGTLAVRAASKVREVVATDYADGMLDRLKARLERDSIKNVEVRRMNGQALELASESFDAAFSLFGLIFFQNRSRGFSELQRVLKPRGRAVVVGWGPIERAPLLAAMMRGVKEALPDLPAPPGVAPATSLQDPTQFATEMIAAGFDEVEITARTLEEKIDLPIEEFFERQARANVMLATLKPKLSDDQWKKVCDSVCTRIREVAGTGPIVWSSEANIGIGRREADEDS